MHDAEITDSVIWFKGITSPDLLTLLENSSSDTPLTLMADNVVGTWQRMKPGKDGRMTRGIRPVGAMKAVWGEWYKTRRGEKITLRAVIDADEYLASTAALFTEWSSPEDEDAFRDL